MFFAVTTPTTSKISNGPLGELVAFFHAVSILLASLTPFTNKSKPERRNGTNKELSK